MATLQFPSDFPRVNGTDLQPFEDLFRPMVTAAAQWLADNPEKAQELAQFNPPAEMPLGMLAAVGEAIPPPGAPASAYYQLRLHIPALAHHPWPEYLEQLRAVTQQVPNDPRPHICRCIWEILNPPARPARTG